MPKVSFASKDALDPSADWIGNLADLQPHVGRFLSERADPTASVFCTESGDRLLLRAGHSEFALHPVSQKTVSVEAGLYSYAKLQSLQIASPAPVIEGFLYEAGTQVLAGRGKVGKSRLIQQASHSIVAGTEFLGMRVPKKRNVLIVDLENGIRTVRERLTSMAGPAETGNGLFVYCANTISDQTIDCSPDGIRRLRAMIALVRAEVLIIDPWRLFLGRDENNAEEVVRGLKMLSTLRESHPLLATLIVHHVRKERFENPRRLVSDARLWTDSVSGHHALASHVDGCWGLERERDDSGEELIVFGGVARNTEPRTILLEDDEHTLRFNVRRNEDALNLPLSKAEASIWGAAVRLGRFSYSKLVTEAKTKNKKAVSSAIKKAMSQGLLARDGTDYIIASPDR